MIELHATQRLLDAHRLKLGNDLGFQLTEDQQILWLLKQVGFTVNMDPDGLSADVVTFCENRMAAGLKIDTIKFVREKTGLGLKEAKDLVEHRWQHLLDQRS